MHTTCLSKDITLTPNRVTLFCTQKPIAPPI